MRGVAEALPMAITAVGGGLAVTVVGVLGWRGRLPRNWFAGIRTSASMRSETAFQAANRVGGPLISAGGSAALLSGLVALALRLARLDAAAWLCALVGIIVMVLLVLAGGLIGSRAAAR